MNDTEEIVRMKKFLFEAWLAIVFVRVSDKRKYGGFIHDFYIQYKIKNYQYTNTLQEAMDGIHKVISKSEKKRVTHKTRLKMEVTNDINGMKQVLHKHRKMKKILFLWFRNSYVKYL